MRLTGLIVIVIEIFEEDPDPCALMTHFFHLKLIFPRRCHFLI